LHQSVYSNIFPKQHITYIHLLRKTEDVQIGHDEILVIEQKFSDAYISSDNYFDTIEVNVTDDHQTHELLECPHMKNPVKSISTKHYRQCSIWALIMSCNPPTRWDYVHIMIKDRIPEGVEAVAFYHDGWIQGPSEEETQPAI
jgi:hypothetical protein